MELSKQRPTILIIDDDEQVRKLFTELLRADNDCTSVESSEDAITVFEATSFDLVISDINMSGISGLELVPTVLNKNPDAVVIMISGQQTIDYAIEAMRAGAFDYLIKPLDIRLIETAVSRALSHHELLCEKRRYENHLEDLVRERTAEIEHLAYYDRLTDLPNRNLFLDQCTKATANAGDGKGPLSVVLVSIDRFKNITDTLGHAAGDQLLKEVATRLRAYVSESRLLARFEGPEFAVLLTQIIEPGDAEEISVSIMESLRKPFYLPAQEVYLTASIGVSLFPLSGEARTAPLQNAGAALYRAKKLGGNNYQVYLPDMNALALNHLALETSVRHAVDNHE